LGKESKNLLAGEADTWWSFKGTEICFAIGKSAGPLFWHASAFNYSI